MAFQYIEHTALGSPAEMVKSNKALFNYLIVQRMRPCIVMVSCHADV